MQRRGPQNKGNAAWRDLKRPRTAAEQKPERMRLTREDAVRQSSNYEHPANRSKD